MQSNEPAQHLIADDLLLLLLDDESGRLQPVTDLSAAIGGALLAELALRNVIEVTDRQAFRRAKVVATAERPELPPVLAAALREVVDEERTAASLVSRLGKNRKGPLLDQLVERGVLRREQGRTLGLFPRTRWPAEDTDHEAEVRRKIEQALRAGRTTDARTATLIALLHSLRVLPKIVRVDGLSSRDQKRHAELIADGHWAAAAVRDAIAAVQAAIAATVVVTTAAT